MKTKITKGDYEQLISRPIPKQKKPKKPSIFWRALLKIVGLPDLMATNFKYTNIGMEKLGKKEPCLILMNHSSFIDLEIATSIFWKRPMNIVATTDSFVGKRWLLRQIGCIPTKKFVTELSLIRDIKYAINTNKCSVLMYPEASYTFDGKATPLPDTLGGFVKMLGVPLVCVMTDGAFLRDPLYNNLQRRKTNVSATVEYLLSPEQIESMSVEEINEVIKGKFTFDNFKRQQENKVKIDAPFRADHLDRVLYKCPHCMAEGKTEGKGIHITCKNCGVTYELDEYGYLKAENGKFTHIPDWYEWERECVREELLSGTYRMEHNVDICMAVLPGDLYSVGKGTLTHTTDGFRLIGCDGKLDYTHSPLSSYSLYADYNWYEIADVICIGNHKAMYYCFPTDEGAVVAKARLATEELFKIKTEKKKNKNKIKIQEK